MGRIVVLLKGKWYCGTVWVSEGVLEELYEVVVSDYFIGYPVEFINDKTGEKYIEYVSPEIFDIISYFN